MGSVATKDNTNINPKKGSDIDIAEHRVEHGNLLLRRVWHLLPSDEILVGKLVRGVVQCPLPLPLHHGTLCPPHRPLLSTQIPSSDAYKTLVSSAGLHRGE